MALIRVFGGGQMSGSVGATTYSHNRFGQYARNRSIPTNPNTPAQSVARANLTAAIASWRSLSSAVREAWNTYAAGTPWVNKLGDTVFLTGMQSYLRYYCFWTHIGKTLPVEVPGSPGQSAIPVFPTQSTNPTDDIDAAGSGLMGVTDNISTQTGLTDNTLYLDVTNMFFEIDQEDVQGFSLWGWITGNTKYFHGSPWRVLYLDVDGIVPDPLIVDLEPIFGALSSGMRLHLQARYIGDEGNWRLSPLGKSYVDALTYTD